MGQQKSRSRERLFALLADSAPVTNGGLNPEVSIRAIA
jgi:hypothetical protein